MMDKPVSRRLVTISLVVVAAVLVSLLLPALLLVAILVDVARKVAASTPAMAVRIVVYGWLYLVAEVVAVLLLAVVPVLGRRRSMRLTYLLQERWASWNFDVFRIVFDVEFQVETSTGPATGPVVVLARHASLIDSLLPVVFIAGRRGPRLRFVLKKELLADPALDIAGNRLPNFFLDRKSRDSETELKGIRDLASDLGEHEGVVIFPEGTRFSEKKRSLLAARAERKSGPIAELTTRFRSVLPPRPSGTLAILEATTADVLVLAHHGLEGMARVVDFWRGGIVGKTVDVAIWRVGRNEIPSERSDRVEWLYRLWLEVDDWVSARRREFADGLGERAPL